MHKYTLLAFLVLLCGLFSVQASGASFKLNSATRVGTGEVDADMRNSARLTYKISLTNTGSGEISAGADGYEVYLYRGGYNASLNSATKVSTLALTETLAPGATTTVEAQFAFPAKGEGDYFFVADPSGNTSGQTYIKVNEYLPKLVLDRGTNSTTYAYIPLDFGFGGTEGRVMTLNFSNDGIAPLTGLQCDVEGPFAVDGLTDIAAGASLTVTVTMTAGEPGWYEGSLVFKAPNVESKALVARGHVSDPELWAEDFETDDFPGSFIVGNYWQITDDPEEIATPGNLRWAANTGTYAVSKSQFVTPRLEVRAGDAPLEIFAARLGSTYTTPATEMAVKYSSDRENWTEALYLEDTSSNSPFGNEFIMSARGNLFKRFTVEIPEGEWFVAIEGKALNVGHITGYRLAEVAHDVMHIEHKLPVEATVNHPYVATLRLRNMNSVTESGYSVSLYSGEQLLASVEPDDFDSGEERTFEVAYYPHEAGMMPVSVAFESGDYRFETEPVEVTVAEEQAVEETFITGTRASSNQQYGPVNAFYRYATSETIYTAEELGLEEGVKIVSLTYLGYRTNESTTGDVSYTAYLARDERNTPYQSPAFRDVADMTQVKASSVIFPSGQSYESTLEYFDPIFKVDFDTPYVYEGGNLCVVFKSVANTIRRGVQFTPYKTDFNGVSTFGRMIYNQSDSDPNAYIQSTYPCMVIVGTEKAVATVTGVVTSNGDPVAGATVRLTSGEVYYETLTDGDGTYSLTVMQLDRLYRVSATAPGLQYEDEAEREIPEGESVIDITLEEGTLSVDGIETEDEGAVRYYNLQGQEVRSPQRGTVLIRVSGTRATKVLIP